MHGWRFPSHTHSSALGARRLLGSLVTLFAGMMVCGDNIPDTCGDYFYLPLFPSCDLFLEAVPCFNHTPTIIVTMMTPSGERIHGFKVDYRSMEELRIFDILSGRGLEGVLVRSTYDISLYLHKTSGDSLIVYPIDAFTREYEIPNMTSSSHQQLNNNKSTTTPRPSTATRTNDNSSNTHHPSDDAVLYLISPFNSTTITLTALTNLDTLPPASSKKIIMLDAFEIHKQIISSSTRYIITSRDIFAAVLIQTKSGHLDENMTLCVDVPITLFDFLPPGFMAGMQFYLAFPNQMAFTLNLHGPRNVTVDILTETSTIEVSLGSLGSAITDITKTSSAWISSTTPIGIYVTLSICSNASFVPSASFILSQLSSTQSNPSKQSQASSSFSSSSDSLSSSASSSSSSSPSSTISPTLCYENGFFLPSVEHFFTCTGNKSKDICLCTCPSVFQKELHRNNFEFDKDNSSETYFPLLVGEIYDISTSISSAVGFNRTYDVVMTTNNSFMVFRHDFDNLNFLPGGGNLVQIYRTCTSRVHEVLLSSCQGTSESKEKTKPKSIESNDDDLSPNPECTCDDIFESSSSSGHSKPVHTRTNDKKPTKSVKRYRVGEFVWEEEEEDTTRPLIAVIVSLSVAIFAVIVLILGYMLEEWISQRKLVRNTKIRPFVS